MRFSKPTAEEVSKYAYKIGFILDGHEFCDYYESKGWVVGKSPMKVWQAAVRTWKLKESRFNKKTVPIQKPIDAEKLQAANKRLRDIAEREWEKRHRVIPDIEIQERIYADAN